MISNQANDARPRRFARWMIQSALPVLLLFALAFFPRALGFEGISTLWHTRAQTFMEAISRGDWDTTLQAPHPGVTTMWLAGLGRLVGTLFVPDYDSLTLLQQLDIELVPLALVIALGIVLAYFLLVRVFDRPVALVAALLLALDPFHISISKGIHVDALVSVFSMVCALLLWVFIKERSWRYILLSGVCAALGLLSKTPGIFLVPYFFLVLFVWQASQWSQHRQQLRQPAYWLRLLRQVGAIVLIWALAFSVTYVLFWPSMWSQPFNTLGVTFGGTRYYRETPHENPSFFMGQATNQDPGPLFYPVNMALKSTAVSFLGFVLSLPLLFRRQLAPHKRLAVGLGLAFVIFFAVQMTLGEKKFARYVLPALQFIALLGGVGWVTWLRILAKKLISSPFPRSMALGTQARDAGSGTRAGARWATWLTRLAHGRFVPLAVSLVLVAIQFAVSIPRHPYYGTHHNYLFGGPKRILESEIVTGQERGEGLEIAGDYLNSLPLSKRLVVGTQMFGSFYYFFEGKSVPLTDDRVDYLLFTRNFVMRSVDSQDWQDEWDAYKTRDPKLVVSFDGVPYVWLYKTGPVVDQAAIDHLVHATMGESVSLLGYDLEPVQARPGETVRLVLYWQALRQDIGDYTVFNHLLDPSGNVVSQKDGQPQGGMYPTYLWDEGERIRDEYQLVVPADAEAGTYGFAVGMYTLQTMERLPITTQSGELPHDRRLLLKGVKVLPE